MKIAMTRSRLLVGLGVVGAGLAAAVHLATPRAEPTPVPSSSAVSLSCRLDSNAELAFRLRSTSETRTGGSHDARHLRLDATVRWRVLAKQGAGWLVAAALDEITLEERPGPETSAAREKLGEPFLFHVRTDCRFSDFAFGPSTDVLARHQLEAMVRTMEFALPGLRARKWTVNQEDMIGTYAGHYAMESGDDGLVRIERQRTRYASLRLSSSAASLSGGLKAEIVRSTASATVDGQGRWLRTLVAEDHVTLNRGSTAIADIRGDLRIERIEAPESARLLALNPSDFSRDAPPPTRGASAGAHVLVPALANATFAEALAHFASMLRGGQDLRTAVEELAAYFAHHPEAIAQLMDGMRRGSVDPALRSALFLALELTGTAEAEVALADAIGDRRFDAVDRMRAAAALADVAKPSERALNALVAQGRTRSADAESQEVSNAATLALGTLAYNAATVDPDLAGQVRQVLATRLGETPGADLLGLLDSAGNAGDPALAPAIQPYTEDPSPRVRARAASAYRRFHDAESDATLTDWLSREPDPRVRRAISETLLERAALASYTPPAELTRVAINQLSSEPDAHVRQSLIRLVGQASSTDFTARQALVAQFRVESDPELQVLIGRYCTAGELL